MQPKPKIITPSQMINKASKAKQPVVVSKVSKVLETSQKIAMRQSVKDLPQKVVLRKTPEPQKVTLFKVQPKPVLFKAEKQTKTLKPIPEKIKSVYGVKGPKPTTTVSQGSTSNYLQNGKRSTSNLSSGSSG